MSDTWGRERVRAGARVQRRRRNERHAAVHRGQGRHGPRVEPRRARRDSSNSKRKGGPSGSGSGSNATECVEAWEGHSSWVNDVAHLRTGDGNFLLSASSDSSVKVWSIDSPSANDSPGA